MTRFYSNSKKELIYNRKLLLEHWLELKHKGVERYNQTIQDEFFLPYYNTLPTQVDALNLKLQQWSFYYNNFRPHRSLLDNRGIPIPPVQFLQQSSLICTEP